MFDGDFDKKTEQDETLEFLQTIGKIVDGRKVVRERIAHGMGFIVLFNDQ